MRNFIDLIIEADRKENIKKRMMGEINILCFLCCCWNSEKQQQHSTLDKKKILCEIFVDRLQDKKWVISKRLFSLFVLFFLQHDYVKYEMAVVVFFSCCCCCCLFFLLLRLQLKLQLQLISCNYWYDKIVLKERIDSNRKEKQRCLFDFYLYYTLFYFFFTFLPIVRRLNVYF